MIASAFSEFGLDFGQSDVQHVLWATQTRPQVPVRIPEPLNVFSTSWHPFSNANTPLQAFLSTGTRF